MARSVRWKGLVWPAIMAAPVFALLIGLGNWQMQRMVWKAGLIASIEAGMAATPIALEEPTDAWTRLGPNDYVPVCVSGQFRHDAERHLFAVDEGVVGWHVYTPLQTLGGNVVMVNRGFVPDGLKHPATRAEGQVAGVVTVVGLVRHQAVQGAFDPAPDLGKNAWYWRDVASLNASVGRAGAAGQFMPFSIDARAEPANPGGWPRGGATLLNISNKHWAYAVTWYGLAAALLGVFAVFAAGRLKVAGE